MATGRERAFASHSKCGSLGTRWLCLWDLCHLSIAVCRSLSLRQDLPVPSLHAYLLLHKLSRLHALTPESW